MTKNFAFRMSFLRIREKYNSRTEPSRIIFHEGLAESEGLIPICEKDEMKVLSRIAMTALLSSAGE